MADHIGHIDNECNSSCQCILSANDMSVTSISQITPCNQHAQISFDKKSYSYSEENNQKETVDGIIINKRADLAAAHHLVKLPERLDGRTKVHLKRIASRVDESIENFQKTNANESNLSPICCYVSRKWIYNFFNHPSGLLAVIYHILLTICLIGYLALLMFTERSTWRETCLLYESKHKVKAIVEKILFAHFLLEFILRVWCSRTQVVYSKLSNCLWLMRYFSRPSHLFDLMLVLGGFFSVTCFIGKLPVDFTQDLYALIMLRGFHRLFNVLQWTSIQSRSSPWNILFEVFQDEGQLLFAMFYVCIVFILLVSYGVFLAEHSTENAKNATTGIDNLMDSLYSMSITLITVGYGDLSPHTHLGQALTAVAIWLAVAFFPLPSGLIGTSVALKVEQNEKRRNNRIRKTLAAIMIQRMWRFERRQRQFNLVQHLLQNRQQAKQSNKTNQILWDKVEYVMANRKHFYASQFIQLILFHKARRLFGSVIQDNSNIRRRTMKTLAMNNQKILNMLQKAQYRIENFTNITIHQKYHDQYLEHFEERLLQMEQDLIRLKNTLRTIIDRSYFPMQPGSMVTHL